MLEESTNVIELFLLSYSATLYMQLNTKIVCGAAFNTNILQCLSPGLFKFLVPQMTVVACCFNTDVKSHILPCGGFGSGISTGSGSLVCESQAPANKP